LVAYVGVLFGLYKLLIRQKDSVIELLKEKVDFLKIQLEKSKEDSPDLLAERLSRRVAMLKEELELLARDHEKNKEIIEATEIELTFANIEVEKLKSDIEKAHNILSEFVCPDCGALMVNKESHTECMEYDGKEIDVDHEFDVFECGMEMIDGKISKKCPRSKRK